MANFNYNLIVLGGHVASDVELRTTPNGVSVTKFTLAVGNGKNEKGEAQTDFFYVTAWRGAAEFFTRYFRKGSSVCVTGEIHSHGWVDDKGVKRIGWEVEARKIDFVDAKSDSAAASVQAGAAPTYTAAPKFEELSEDEELPFSI